MYACHVLFKKKKQKNDTEKGSNSYLLSLIFDAALDCPLGINEVFGIELNSVTWVSVPCVLLVWLVITFIAMVLMRLKALWQGISSSIVSSRNRPIRVQSEVDERLEKVLLFGLVNDTHLWSMRSLKGWENWLLCSDITNLQTSQWLDLRLSCLSSMHFSVDWALDTFTGVMKKQVLIGWLDLLYYQTSHGQLPLYYIYILLGPLKLRSFIYFAQWMDCTHNTGQSCPFGRWFANQYIWTVTLLTPALNVPLIGCFIIRFFIFHADDTLK